MDFVTSETDFYVFIPSKNVCDDSQSWAFLGEKSPFFLSVIFYFRCLLRVFETILSKMGRKILSVSKKFQKKVSHKMIFRRSRHGKLMVSHKCSKIKRRKKAKKSSKKFHFQKCPKTIFRPFFDAFLNDGKLCSRFFSLF